MADCIWKGDAQVIAQVDRITLTKPTSNSSTYTVTCNGKNVASGPWAYDHAGLTHLEIATALAALLTASTIAEFQEMAYAASDGTTEAYVDVTGGTDGEPFTITVAESGTGNGTMSRAAATTPQGPNWFSVAANWSGGAVPVDNDVVIYADSDVGCFYGLSNSAITPSRIAILASYTGEIGLPPDTGDYREYRDLYLALGVSGDSINITVDVGEGEGKGSGRICLNTGSSQATLTVRKTGTPKDTDKAAFRWKGTAATNAAKFYGGSIAVAALAGETANLAGGLDIGYTTNPDSDVDVWLGEKVTLGTINKYGGVLVAMGRVAAAITALTNWAGDATIWGTDAVSQLNVRGGTVRYNTNGTLGGNTIVSGDGVLDFSQDLRAKAVTNPIEVYGDEADVKDPHKVVASLVVDYNETSRLASIGRNVRVTRGTPA